MTPQQLKAMKQALEALKLLTGAWQTFGALDYGDNAITALEEVLAEHAMQEVQRLGQEIEQAPYSVQQAYAMAQVCLDLHEALGCKWGDNPYLTISQLKASPPQRTEQVPAPGYCKHCKQYTIEEPLPPQPEQEPVAYMSHSKESFVSADDVGNSVPNWTDYYPTPLYAMPKPCPTCEALARTVMLDQTSHDTAPPQRKPLTDEQIEQLEQDTCAMEFPETVRAIEAAHGIKENT